MANNNNNSMNLRSLVSIEYVRVKEIVDKEINNDEVNPLLYGTVIVTDCCGDDIVYHEYFSTFDWRQCLSLIGPSRAISGDDTFIISVNFWANYWKREQMIEKEIARGEIVWDPHTRDLSSHVQEDVPGKHGSVIVGYSVIKPALSVTVKVVMMNVRRAKICGTVKAERLLGGSWMLYDTRSSDRETILREDPNLSLTRPTFAVPVDSNLTITVDLRRYNRKNLSSDDQIAMGSVQFTVKFGKHVETINGKDKKNHRDVQVHITCE